MKTFSSFIYQNKEYGLSHLNAFYCEYRQPETTKHAEKIYRCLIEFSHHCFTKSPNFHKGETFEDYASELHYHTEKENRIFCFERYELSLQLPEILKSIQHKKCFFTSANDKFLTVSIIDKHGKPADYEIYFSLKKAKHCDIYIFINSAYIRTADYHGGTLRKIKRKPISFFILLKNTLEKRKIKRPK